MINSHKELIEEIKLFVSKMDSIDDFVYIKDLNTLHQEIIDKGSRVFAIGMDSVEFDDENYNSIVKYKFAIADDTIYDDDSIINCETEQLFVLSALKDYLNFIQDASVELDSVEFMTETDADSAFSTVSGEFSFIIKRSASYWKMMDSYSV